MSGIIVALSAYPRDNAGMMSVNLALAQLAPCRVIFANLEASEEGFWGLLRYSDKVTKGILEEATVVGWGDFIHCLTWVNRELVMHLEKNKGLKPEETLGKWYGLHMLHGVEPRKTLSFGSSLYINPISAYSDPIYAEALKALRRKCSLLSFRDPLSPVQLKNLVGIDASVGCDSAMFLQSDRLPRMPEMSLPPDLAPGRYIVTATGRSGFANEQASFINALSYVTGLSAVKIDWLNTRSDEAFLRSLKILQNAKLCVTDIYHLCVNCLRERVPVFCFYRSGFAGHSLDDEKKRLLFYGYGLHEYLIDLDQMAFSKSSAFRDFVIKKTVSRLEQDSLYEMLNRNIPANVALMKEQLRDHIVTGCA